MCFAGGACLSFWYHISEEYSGTLRVMQSVGNEYEQTSWYQTSVHQDEWRLGYAEMLQSPYDWTAVFEAERGAHCSFAD